MIKILHDPSLVQLSRFFEPPFHLTAFNLDHDLNLQLRDQDVLLCRSTLRVDRTLLAGSSISCVATASSGIDHIDLDYLQQSDIHLYHAKGTNAVAVADYVVACMAYLEKQALLKGIKIGVLGVGAVGTQVVNRLQALKFDVISYDPLRAMQEQNFISCSQEDLRECDVLCLHAYLHDSLPYASRHLLNDSFLSQLKPNTVIINAARGDIVDEKALLKQSFPLVYCTDVYANEPKINPTIIQYAELCTPHIAGHSIEARSLALQVLSDQIHQRFNLQPSPSSIKSQQAKIECALAAYSNWQDFILSIYNPFLETQMLKQAQDSTTTFLTLRKAHGPRHNFCEYDSPTQEKNYLHALGYK